MLLAAEMLEEKIHNKTNKLPNNESSESGGTAEETSDWSNWQKSVSHTTCLLRDFAVTPSKPRTYSATKNNT